MRNEYMERLGTMYEILKIGVEDPKMIYKILKMRVEDPKMIYKILKMRVKYPEMMDKILTMGIKEPKTIYEILKIGVEHPEMIDKILKNGVEDPKTIDEKRKNKSVATDMYTEIAPQRQTSFLTIRAQSEPQPSSHREEVRAESQQHLFTDMVKEKGNTTDKFLAERAL